MSGLEKGIYGLADGVITAILVFEVQLISNKTNGVVITIFTSMALLLVGSYFYNALCEPETIYKKVTTTFGTVSDGSQIANPAYIGGTLRNVYETILSMLPTGQLFLIREKTVAQPVVMCGSSLAVIIASIALGLFLFRKKDIK